MRVSAIVRVAKRPLLSGFACHFMFACIGLPGRLSGLDNGLSGVTLASFKLRSSRGFTVLSVQSASRFVPRLRFAGCWFAVLLSFSLSEHTHPFAQRASDDYSFRLLLIRFAFVRFALRCVCCLLCMHIECRTHLIELREYRTNESVERRIATQRLKVDAFSARRTRALSAPLVSSIQLRRRYFNVMRCWGDCECASTQRNTEKRNMERKQMKAKRNYPKRSEL
jgi:hypothetical protein